MIEGAAAVTVAAYQKVKDQYEGKICALVICGANLKTEVLSKLLNKYA